MKNHPGLFQPGNAGGPGRPKKEREARYLEITLNTVTFEKWADVVKKALEQALTGDKDARKWLSEYLVGVPVQRIAPTTPDGENPYMEISADELIELARKIAGRGGVG